MIIGAYKKISKTEINEQRYTSEGKLYNLNHNKNLVIDMKYLGDTAKKYRTNAQGWERNHKYYFNELSSKHPEYFSKKNQQRIKDGKSPHVDARWVKHFPECKGYENQTLIHHHIGGDGQAVAIPKGTHKGSGEIHSVENKVGVTNNAKNFTKSCEEYCKRNPDGIGKTANQLKVEMEKENVKEFQPVEQSENSKKNNVTRSR